MACSPRPCVQADCLDDPDPYACLAQGAGSYRGDLLGDQAVHDGVRRVDLGLPGALGQPVSGRDRRIRCVPGGHGAAAPDRSVRALGLLAGGLDGRGVRDDGCRCDAHRVPGALCGLVLVVCRVAVCGLLELVEGRADAFDSQHHHIPARALLLGCGSCHLRHGNRARRSRRLHAEPRLPLRRNPVRGVVRAPRTGLLHAADQPDPRFLGGLRDDASAWCVVRRLDREEHERRRTRDR